MSYSPHLLQILRGCFIKETVEIFEQQISEYHLKNETESEEQKSSSEYA